MEKGGTVGVEFLKNVIFDLLLRTGKQEGAEVGEGVFEKVVALG